MCRIINNDTFTSPKSYLNHFWVVCFEELHFISWQFKQTFKWVWYWLICTLIDWGAASILSFFIFFLIKIHSFYFSMKNWKAYRKINLSIINLSHWLLDSIIFIQNSCEGSVKYAFLCFFNASFFLHVMSF